VHLVGFVIRMYLPVFDTYRCHYGNWTRLPITVIEVVTILQNSVHFFDSCTKRSPNSTSARCDRLSVRERSKAHGPRSCVKSNPRARKFYLGQ